LYLRHDAEVACVEPTKRRPVLDEREALRLSGQGQINGEGGENSFNNVEGQEETLTQVDERHLDLRPTSI
jgi:hypothetical protein